MILDPERHPLTLFSLLEEGEVILATDEWYDPYHDEWRESEDEYVGLEWNPVDFKPTRRRNPTRRGGF